MNASARFTACATRRRWPIGLLLGLLAFAALISASPALAQSAPGTPALVSVSRSGDTLTASWDAPAGATKYHVTYSSDNKNSWTAAAGPGDGHSAASITISGIDTSKSYIVAVRAGNQHGWSGWRNSASNPPEAPPSAPGAITITRADGTLTASWNAVSGADTYHITYSSDNRKSWSLASFDHASASITFAVSNAHTYIVGVRAGKTSGNATLWSGWRNSSASGPWGPPAAPAQVSFSRDCSRFSFSWTPVAGATGYDLVSSYTNRKSWQRMATNTTSTGGVFTHWQKDKTYYLGVRARNANGMSGWTNSAAAHPPACNIGRAGNLKATTSTTHGTAGGAITTTWDAGQHASAYNLNYKEGADWRRIASNLSATTHTGTVSSTATTAFAVQSIGNGTTSQWREANIGWLTASGISGTSATLTIAGHSDAWYLKQTSPTPAGTCSSAISGTTHALTTLLGDTDYTFTAYNDAACAQVIGSASFTTSAASAVPSAPAAPALTTGAAQLKVDWTAPSHNGSAIIDYDVRVRAQGTNDWSDSYISGATHSPGTIWNNVDSNGGAGQAIDFGTITLSGLTVTKINVTGGIQNVYKISEPIGAFRLKLRVSNGNVGTTSTYQARYASTAPTTSNMNTHGTRLWQTTLTHGQQYTGDTRTYALPANTHFWVAATEARYVRASQMTIEADTTRIPSPLTMQATGLTNGTTYEVQVRAVNANGAGAWSSSGTQKAGLPAQPAAPTLLSGHQQITASWPAASGNGSDITDYDLRYSSDGSTWTDVEMDSAANTARSHVIASLTNNTTYQVQLRATNTHGDGLWSPSASVKAGAPDAPAAPALASGNAQLTATWAEPTTNGSAITGYGVEYSTNGTTWSSANVAITLSTRTAVITGLTNDTSYQVRVRATNARATGAWSPSATDKPGRPPAPSTPTLTAGAKQLTVAWTGTANGLAITDYDVQYRKSGATDWEDWTHTGTAVSATITGLEGVATYEVRVRAESSAGEGPWSAASSLATNAGVPDAPTAPTLALGTAGQITVGWTAPHNGGSALTGFKVQYKRSADSTWSTHSFSSSGATTSTIIGSLTTGTKYDVQVRATNSEGDGAWSATTQGTVGGLSTVTVTVTPGDRQLVISWTAPADAGSAITDYDVRYRQTNSQTWNRVFDGGTSGLINLFDQETTNGPSGDPLNYGSLSLSSVTNEDNGLYKFGAAVDEMQVIELKAYNNTLGNDTILSLRRHSSKPSGNIYTAGTELASVSKSAGGNRSFRFTPAWYGPFNANDYFWVASDRSLTPGSRSISISVDLATTATTYTLSGLRNNQEYAVQVRAATASADSEWSTQVIATTVPPPAAPAAPTLTPGNTQLTADWTAPASGPAIVDYDLRYRAQGTSTWTDPFLSPASYFRSGSGQNNKQSDGSTGKALDLGAVSLSGLTVTKVSTGGISNVYKISGPVGALRVKLEAKGASQGGRTYRARYAPTAPSTSNMNTHGTLLWERTAGYGSSFSADAWAPSAALPLPANTHFWIATTADGRTDIVQPTIEVDAATVPSPLRSTVTGLTNGTTYEIQVRAAHANGTGAWSPSGTLKAGLPAQPSAPTLVSGNRQLTVSWPATSGNGSNITDYDIRYSSDNGSTWTTLEMNSTANTARSYVITNLNNNTYVAQVRATNTHGDSLWSPSSASTEVGAPEEVTAPTLTPTSTSQLTVTWTAPNDAGSAITGYDVEYSTDGSNWSSTNVTVTLSTRTATITGLSANTAYRVRVRAENARGKGGWSPSTTLATISASNISHNSATLSIARGSHTGNWYVKKTAPTPAGSCSSVITGTTHNLSSLTRNTTYTYTAYSDSNCTTAIAITSFSTLPSTLSVSHSYTTATLTIAHNTGNWYVKATSSNASCSGASSTATHSLSSLTDGAAYTYHAYSDSSCTTMIARGSQFVTALYAPTTIQHYGNGSCPGAGCEITVHWIRNSNSAAGDIGYQLQIQNPNWKSFATINPGADVTWSHTAAASQDKDIRIRATRTINGVTRYSAWAY